MYARYSYLKLKNFSLQNFFSKNFLQIFFLEIFLIFSSKIIFDQEFFVVAEINLTSRVHCILVLLFLKITYFPYYVTKPLWTPGIDDVSTNLNKTWIKPRSRQLFRKLFKFEPVSSNKNLICIVLDSLPLFHLQSLRGDIIYCEVSKRSFKMKFL